MSRTQPITLDDANKGTRLIRKAELVRRMSLHPNTLDNWVKQSRFPAPVKLGRMCVWPSNVVADWMADKILGDS